MSKRVPKFWPSDITYGNSIRVLAPSSCYYDLPLPSVSPKIELFRRKSKTLSVRAKQNIEPGEIVCYYAVILETRLFEGLIDCDSLGVLPNSIKGKIRVSETQSFGNESRFIPHTEKTKGVNVCFGKACDLNGARASPIVAVKKIRPKEELLLGGDGKNIDGEFPPYSSVVFTDRLSNDERGFVTFKTPGVYSHSEYDAVSQMHFSKIIVYDSSGENPVWKERPYKSLHAEKYMYQREEYKAGDSVYYKMVDARGYWRWVHATVLGAVENNSYQIQIFGFFHDGFNPTNLSVHTSDIWVYANADEQ